MLQLGDPQKSTQPRILGRAYPIQALSKPVDSIEGSSCTVPAVGPRDLGKPTAAAHSRSHLDGKPRLESANSRAVAAKSSAKCQPNQDITATWCPADGEVIGVVAFTWAACAVISGFPGHRFWYFATTTSPGGRRSMTVFHLRRWRRERFDTSKRLCTRIK